MCVCLCKEHISLPQVRSASGYITSQVAPNRFDCTRYRVSQCVGYEHTGGHTNSNKCCVILVDTPFPAGENDISICRLDKISQQLDDNHSCVQAFPGSVSTMLKLCTFSLPNTFSYKNSIVIQPPNSHKISSH